MAGVSQKNSNSKNTLFLLLLLLWLLNKIGLLVILLLRIVITPPLALLKTPLLLVRLINSSKKRKTTLPLTKSSTNHASSIFPKKRHRGRPRTTPLPRFLYLKYKKLLRKIFPTPLRIGVAVSIVLVLVFLYSLFLILIAHDIPSPEKLSTYSAPMTTEFYDRSGKLLYRLYSDRNRTPVNLSDLPPNVVNATVAIEDKNFWAHPGIDFFGISRAIVSDLSGKDIQGGSTITQQLIKNTLLTPDRTWERKMKEVLLAYWTERIFTKKQILQMYFNQVPYGGPAWGVQAAAQTYFRKDAKNLDLAEAAYLAGLPASPTEYSPFGDHPEFGKDRQKEVLRRMREDGYITRDQEQQAQDEELTFQTPVDSIKAPHFVMYVRSVLASKYGEALVSQGGLRVYTSLDLNLQQMAQQSVDEQLAKLGPQYNISNGAAMIEDPKSGQILAMVGSRDYFDPNGGNFNVTLALRQPGSSIKPLTYATAFKMGYSPGNIVDDSPVNYNGYAPVNYDGKFHGAVTIRTALGSSLNIPAVKTLANVGIPNMIQTSRDLGITTFTHPNEYGLSITLGGAAIRMIDMMSVYSAFADMGIRHESTPILKVTDSQGNVIEDDSQTEGINVLSPGVSYLIDNILSDNNARASEFGTNSQLYIPGHTVAAKTGTTNDIRDNWTFGFTPNYVVGVWVGNNNNSPMAQGLVSGITGAAPIWNQIMVNLIKDKPDVAFARPPEIATGLVDGHMDLVVNGITSKGLAAIIASPSASVTPAQGSISLDADSSGQLAR